MKKRVYGAILVVLYALAMVLSPRGVYLSLVYLLGIMMISELFSLAASERLKTPAVVLFSFLFLIYFHVPQLGFLIFNAGVLLLFGYAVLVEKEVQKTFFAVVLFFVYILLGAIAIGKLNREYFLVLISLVWSVDTFAYFTGKSIGRRKLAPSISPKKTVEGFLGGIFGGVSVPLLVGCLLGVFDFSVSNLFLFLFLSVLAQVGDLFESFLKRYFGVKDSGETIPGHGGVLDRLDSAIAVAPFLVVFGGLQ